MSGYVRSTDFAIDFDGATITGKLKPLSLPDLLKMQDTQVETDEDGAKVLAEIVPFYVTDFSGAKAADGSDVPIQEVCSSAYFLELAMDIGRKLLAASRPPQKPSLPSAT